MSRQGEVHSWDKIRARARGCMRFRKVRGQDWVEEMALEQGLRGEVDGSEGLGTDQVPSDAPQSWGEQ